MEGDQPPDTAKKANWVPTIALGLLGVVTLAIGAGFFILIAAVLVSPPVHRWLGERAARKGKVHGTEQAVLLSLAVILGPWVALLVLGAALMPFAIPEMVKESESAPTKARNTAPAKAVRPPSQSPAVQVPRVRSAWRYFESDDPMGGHTKTACVGSEDEIRQELPYRNTTVTLCIRKESPGELDAYVQLDEGGQVLCHSFSRCRLRVRFDDAAPQSWPGTEPADYSPDLFFLRRAEKLVTALKTTKVFRLEMEIYLQGTQTVTFKTEALQWP